jgi:hypothetical protein
MPARESVGRGQKCGGRAHRLFSGQTGLQACFLKGVWWVQQLMVVVESSRWEGGCATDRNRPHTVTATQIARRSWAKGDGSCHCAAINYPPGLQRRPEHKHNRREQPGQHLPEQVVAGESRGPPVPTHTTPLWPPKEPGASPDACGCASRMPARPAPVGWRLVGWLVVGGWRWGLPEDHSAALDDPLYGTFVDTQP